jgi:uncharacterized protein YukE
MTAVAYQNELETQFSKLPGFLQDALRSPFNWVDGMLKDIAGQPQQLVAAGETYAALGAQVAQVANQQAQDRLSILPGAWDGPAYEAFSAKMEQVEAQIEFLAQSTGQTQQILDSAAQACAESASAIVSIVEGVISFALGDAVISGVTALFTLGGSVVAGAAAAVAKFAEACDEIGGIIARLTAVLEKIASLLEKIAKILEDVKAFMERLQTALKETKGLKTKFTTMKGLVTFGEKAAVNSAVHAAVGLPLIGSPLPGIVGGVGHGVSDGGNAAKNAQQAKGQQ